MQSMGWLNKNYKYLLKKINNNNSKINQIEYDIAFYVSL